MIKKRKGSAYRKGKSYIELYGEDVARAIKKKISISNKNKIRSEEMKSKISDYFKDESNKEKISKRNKKISKTLTGKKHTKEHINNNRLAKLGTKQSKETIEKRRKKLLGHKVSEKTINFNRARKGKNFKELYGNIKAEKIRSKIKEKRKYQITPTKDTSIEVKIQNFLKKLKIEYFTHQYMKEIKHGYQCDIFIPVQNGIPIKTIIECDGDYWHGNPEYKKNFMKYNKKIREKRCLDYERTSQLEEQGFRVIRLWEHEIRPMQINKFKEKLI